MASKQHLLPLLRLLLGALTCDLSSCAWVEELEGPGIVSVLERDEISSDKAPIHLDYLFQGTALVQIGHQCKPCCTVGDGKLGEEEELRRSQLFGGQGGIFRDINVNANPPSRLDRIILYHNEQAIHAISFQYTTPTNQQVNVGPWGRTKSDNGTDFKQNWIVINATAGERVIEMFGTTGDYNNERVIRSFGVITKQRQDGPFGAPLGRPFIFETSGRIVAFYGRSQSFLHAIGAYYFS